MDSIIHSTEVTVDENRPFELPNPSEKLSYKFILDSTIETTASDYSDAPCESTSSEAMPSASLASELPLDQPTEVESVSEAPQELTPDSAIQLPYGKKYFRIGEVADLLKVEAYVLRYWESEFSTVRPEKSASGHRVYSRRDVETLLWIRHLLHVEKFSVKGAKKKLLERKREMKSRKDGIHAEYQDRLKELAREMRELIQLVKSNPGVL